MFVFILCEALSLSPSSSFTHHFPVSTFVLIYSLSLSVRKKLMGIVLWTGKGALPSSVVQTAWRCFCPCGSLSKLLTLLGSESGSQANPCLLGEALSPWRRITPPPTPTTPPQPPRTDRYSTSNSLNSPHQGVCVCLYVCVCVGGEYPLTYNGGWKVRVKRCWVAKKVQTFHRHAVSHLQVVLHRLH